MMQGAITAHSDVEEAVSHDGGALHMFVRSCGDCGIKRNNYYAMLVPSTYPLWTGRVGDIASLSMAPTKD